MILEASLYVFYENLSAIVKYFTLKWSEILQILSKCSCKCCFPPLDSNRLFSLILYLPAAPCLSLLLFLCLLLRSPLLQAAWRTAESRLRFISDFLNVLLPVPLPARQPVCPPVYPPACLDIGFALSLWPYTRRATGATATAGPSVLSCRVMSSCRRGPSLPPTIASAHTPAPLRHVHLLDSPLHSHSDKGICQADEQSELKRCVMHAWKDLTSCRGRDDAGWRYGVDWRATSRTLEED